MYKSKLIKVLLCFNSEEKEQLRKWIHSPTHNKRLDRIKLFEYLLNKRTLTPFNTTNSKVYLAVYGKKNYADQKFKKLLNLGMQLLENFIHFSSKNKDGFSKQKALIEFIQNRKLPQYAQQYLLKAKKTLTQVETQDHFYFDKKLQLEQLQFEEIQTQADRSNTNLQEIIHLQHISFTLEALRFACEAITHQRLYKSNYHFPLLDAVLDDIDRNDYSDYPAIQLYYYSYLSLRHPEDTTNFKALKSLLKTSPQVLSKNQLKSIYLIAINYCVQQLNNGVEAYVQEVFELYQYGLEHSILIENNILSRFTYKNIVAAAIRLREYDWINWFLETYTQLLEDNYRQNYALYAQSKLAFAQKRFDQALLILTQVEFDNIFLNMDAKVMLLKIYYENKDFDALDALLVSFRRFLQRKSILAYQRQIHENMLNLTTKLLNLPSSAKAKKVALRQEIEQTHPLTEKPWLLQQLSFL
jgi:hypothetical protein